MMRFINLLVDKQLLRPVINAIIALIAAILEAKGIKKTSEKTSTIILISSFIAYAFLVITSHFEIIVYSKMAEDIFSTVVGLSMLGSIIVRAWRRKHSEGAEKQEANRAADHADDSNL